MSRCIDLQLPEDAFVSLKLPTMNTPVAIGETQHLLWLCRLMWLVLHAVGKEGNVTPQQLLVRMQRLDQLDQLCIAYAKEYFSCRDLDAWSRIETLASGLSELSLPLRYKQRDRHIPALKLYLTQTQWQPSDDAVFVGLITLSSYEPEHYLALVALLEQSDGLVIAKTALSAFALQTGQAEGAL